MITNAIREQERESRAPRLAEPQRVVRIPGVSHENKIPVSYSQERYLAGYEWQQTSGRRPMPFHIIDAISIAGPLDASALEEAINRVVARHAGLRASFTPDPAISGAARGELLEKIQTQGYVPTNLYYQHIAPEAHVPLRAESGGGSHEEIIRFVQREASEYFDLAQAPLIRATLFANASEKHLLIITAHHLICDLVSQRIMRDELREFYRAIVNGTPAELPAVTVHYPDFAAWQHEILPLSPSLEYWKNTWREAEKGLLSYGDFPFSIPVFSGRAPMPAYERLEAEQGAADLREAANAAGVSLHTVFLAALGVMLHRWTRRPLVSVWNMFPNRSSEIMHSAGWFMNAHLVPMDFAGDPSLKTVLRRIADAHLEAARNQEIPTLLIWRSLSKPLRFTDLTVMFNFAEEASPAESGTPAMNKLPVADMAQARFPTGLEIIVIGRDTSFTLLASYFEDRFPPLAAKMLLDGMVRIAFLLLGEAKAKVSTVTVAA
jgi:hypothetical protein